jgi:type IV secretory pathway TraG/TraD family ATPase VirD4
VKDFWEKEAQKAGGDAALANMVPYITSKLTQFVANDIMRPIISQQKSAFNFRSVMDEQKILLINLSKGRLGDLNSALLGMICVGKLLMAALSRVDIPESERKDFYLYVDEFQNFVTESIAIILSEARKYRLDLTMAHQYITQLSKNNNTSVRDAVFGNVGTIIAFRVGVEDAETIAQQFAPVFDEYDVMNVAKFNAYIRMLIDNQNQPAFSFAPDKPGPSDGSAARRIRQTSRMKYGRPREEVEREILERAKMAAAPPPPLPPIA